jgi:hypothetical protein
MTPTFKDQPTNEDGCDIAHVNVGSAGLVDYTDENFVEPPRFIRACVGVLPVHRLKAWVKALISWYPNSHAIVVIGRLASPR